MTSEMPENLKSSLIEALRRSAAEEYDKAVRSIPVPTEKIDSVFREAIKSSDRSTAILVFALIDDILIFYYRLYLNANIKGGHDSLFDGFGLLPTAHSRITLAASLFWIPKVVYDDLLILKRIRNYFAHDTSFHGFHDNPVKGLIHSLVPSEKGMSYFNDLSLKEVGDRRIFLVRAAVVIAKLVSSLVLIKVGKDVNIDVKIFDMVDLPPNVIEVSDTISALVMEIMIGNPSNASG